MCVCIYFLDLLSLSAIKFSVNIEREREREGRERPLIADYNAHTWSNNDEANVQTVRPVYSQSTIEWSTHIFI